MGTATGALSAEVCLWLLLWTALTFVLMAPQVPFLFKYAIDGLTGDPSGATAADMPLWEVLPATLLLGYGAARAGSALCNEARNFVFAKVSPCTL